MIRLKPLSVSCLVLAICGLADSTNADAADRGESSMTSRVNDHLKLGWEKAGIQPADPASDAVFVRRAFLDLTGVIPTVGEVREFLADKSPRKRERLIDRLIGTGKAKTGRNGSSRFATRLANIWQDVMLPQVNTNNLFRFRSGAFNAWLRGHFADNTPYDKIARELITYTGQTTRGNGPGLFYQVLELKPEELAASTSRIFMGVQIQCAQCHNHPFDHWTQKDFWGYAAFFAQLQRRTGAAARFVNTVADTSTGDVKLPDTKTVVKPQFLGKKTQPQSSGSTRRQQLANWLTSKDNPYFAKATVNRVWAIMFGYGLVDPVDDFGKHNPPSHPQLLNDLAADFADHGYDLRRLFRILAKSRSYQLSSKVKLGEPEYPNLFNRMAVKSLTPEQLYNCLEIATAKRDTVSTARNRGSFGYRNNAAKQQFISKFEAPTQGATEFQAGIPQALTMMNGLFVNAATDPSRSDILIAVSESPFMNDVQRVETLFLAVVSRKPTKAERDKFVKYVKSGGPQKDSRKALSDVMWALLNSTEFILNH